MTSPRHLRDVLISRARIGDIEPQQAEAEANAAGLPPLAAQADAQKFDPMKESRWSLVQAVAWIAWRDTRLVMEQNTEYRAHSTHWLFEEWNEPDSDRKTFTPRKGWFLKALRPSGLMHITMLDVHLKANDNLPPTAQMTPSEAEKELWQALSEEKLSGEGFDKTGVLVDIPPREWCRLEVFEEGECEVLKYNPLDRTPPFTEVRFRRHDLLRLWPMRTSTDAVETHLGCMTDLPLKLMVGTSPYVPLSLAICWVATSGGTNQVSLEDQNAWKIAADAMMERICDSSGIEIIGRDGEQMTRVLPRTAFAALDVPHPFHQQFEYVLSEVTHVNCYFFENRDEWAKSFNDQYYLAGKTQPIWTHLQVDRIQVIKLWPRPSASARAKLNCKLWLMEQMRQSPSERPMPKNEYKKEAVQRFSRLTERQFSFAWNEAIEESGMVSWARAGRPKQKSNHHVA